MARDQTYGEWVLPRTTARPVALALGALAAAVLAPAAHGATSLPPPSEGVITDKPPPPLQGPPGKTAPLPCGIDGPTVGVAGDGVSYPSGRRPLRAAMIFVDFSDAPAGPGSSPREVYDRLVPDARRTLRALSYGKFRLLVTPHLRWVRIPKPLSSYGFDGIDPYARYHRYLTDALRAAARDFDLSKFKTAYVVAGPGADPPQAQTDQAAGQGIKAGRARIEHEVTLRGFGSDSFPGVMVHETGHVLGLPDLYKVGIRDRWDRFVGPWDIMSNDWLAAPMMSWTRRMVGWLDDRDFRCVRKSTVRLSPVASPGGIKGVVLRTGRRRAYVVEARTDSVGPDCPSKDGVLVYKWNGDVETGKGPIQVIDAQPGDVAGCGAHAHALFKPKPDESSTYTDRRIAVKVLGGDETGFRVRVVQRRNAPTVGQGQNAPRVTRETALRALRLVRGGRLLQARDLLVLKRLNFLRPLRQLAGRR